MRGKQKHVVDASSHTAEVVLTTGIEAETHTDDEDKPLAAYVVQKDNVDGNPAVESAVQPDNEMEVKRDLRRKAAERRAEKKRRHDILFPEGVPDGLPDVDLISRFNGERAIIRITAEGDGTIRFDLNDGGVFWKDCDDPDGVNEEDRNYD